MWNEIIGEFNLSDFANEGVQRVDINIEDSEINLKDKLDEYTGIEKERD